MIFALSQDIYYINTSNDAIVLDIAKKTPSAGCPSSLGMMMRKVGKRRVLPRNILLQCCKVVLEFVVVFKGLCMVFAWTNGGQLLERWLGWCEGQAICFNSSVVFGSINLEEISLLSLQTQTVRHGGRNHPTCFVMGCTGILHFLQCSSCCTFLFSNLGGLVLDGLAPKHF